ncbi:MAG: DUF6100 family protein [Roseburia sp.]|nr:DUF6100 family protein [Roseburia sp.]
MACNDYFLKTFMNLEKHYNKLGKEIENTRMIMKGWDTEFAYAYSLRIHEEAERLALLARNMPCHLGIRDAEERVRSEMEKIVPIKIGYTEEGWFSIQMFSLLPRKEHGTVNYIRQCLYYEMRKFYSEKVREFQKDCVLIYRHVYYNGFPERQMRDHDNIEINMVTDIIATYVLCDDGPSVCRHYYCSAKGSENRCEVYVVPQTDFEKWLEAEKKMPNEGIKLFPESPKNI